MTWGCNRKYLGVGLFFLAQRISWSLILLSLLCFSTLLSFSGGSLWVLCRALKLRVWTHLRREPLGHKGKSCLILSICACLSVWIFVCVPVSLCVPCVCLCVCFSVFMCVFMCLCVLVCSGMCTVLCAPCVCLCMHCSHACLPTHVCSCVCVRTSVYVGT